MTYSIDLAGSAHRHWGAAISLLAGEKPGTSLGNMAVAGYLFGLAGELALKKMMSDSGMRPLKTKQKQDDPFYAHFPHLKTLLRNGAKGRLQGTLVRHAIDARLFNNWNVEMRYAPTKEIQEKWTHEWRDQADKLVQAMNL